MTKKIVVMPDTHAPIEDRRLVRAFIKFVGEYQPDELVCTGDLMDYPQPSRWSKDTAAEFEGSVFADSEHAKLNILKEIRNVYSGPFGVIEGNHDERPRTYLSKYAPALSESRAFDLDTLLDFESFEVASLPTFYDFAPGWTMTHGHKGGIRLNQAAGVTALNAARKFGKSVVHGHTHRLGVISHSEGYDAQVNRVLTGMEVGHFCDMKLAGYLKGGAANWQQGFGLITVDGQHVKAEAVPVQSGKFIVEGTTFSVR